MSLGHNIAFVTVTVHSIAKIFSGVVLAKILALAGLAAGFVTLLRNRRAFRRLAEMNDAELRDIGLTPGDLYAARSLPFGQDPTLALARTVNERFRRSSAMNV